MNLSQPLSLAFGWLNGWCELANVRPTQRWLTISAECGDDLAVVVDNCRRQLKTTGEIFGGKLVLMLVSDGGAIVVGVVCSCD